MAIKSKLEVWSDLNPALVTDAQGNIKKDINADAVRGSIDNILKTNPGERIMLPEFAISFKSFVFEPINELFLNRFSNAVRDAIEIWDDRVAVEEITFKVDPDYSKVTIGLTFKIKSYYKTFTHATTINL